MKLNRHNLDNLTDKVAKPTYLARDTRHGIAHIGVGGFHRAHQAYYTDALLNQGRDLDWSICGIGLRPEDRKVRDDLAEQDYLYTLFELDDGDDSQSRIIGSLTDMLLAEEGIHFCISSSDTDCFCYFLFVPDRDSFCHFLLQMGLHKYQCTGIFWHKKYVG